MDWKKHTKEILKRELKKKKVTYSGLVERLKELSVEETVPGIKNKISRGTFNAVFFIQCLRAIGCRSVKLED
ncbi:MAG: DUF6471 domain-containing protein [Spirochaetota bacterium]|nr:DUF6471 domain-containing protein [Spirochaetota bacterium]